MDNDILLSVQGIVMDFPGTRALSDVTLDVKKGEILGLIGENGAGKSTLMNIISGVLSPTKGKIIFDGDEVKFSSPDKAQRIGIGFVHQELSLCPHLSVAENIFIGRLPKKKSELIDKRKLYHDSNLLLKELQSNVKPGQSVDELSVADQQIVELAKSLSLKCKLLIFDEPTSSLTESEAQVLFSIIQELKKKGISILYISHRLNEIFGQCSRIAILRDGHMITTVQTETADYDDIICKMVGREIKNMYAQKEDTVGSEMLKVEHLSSTGVFQDVSFHLRKGEILGFSGLIGAGRTEVMRTLCGINPRNGGTIYFEGKKIDFQEYSDSIHSGIVYLTEDRKTEGLFLNMDIMKNISAASLYKVKKNHLINHDMEVKLSRKYIKELNVKVSDLHHAASSLSGGNQQKLLIAKWLSTNPKIIIMDEPTRGIDIGAKVEIYTLLRSLANQGVGVIMISSEMPEIVGMCDRVMVMHEGKITGEVCGNNIHEETIMKHAAGAKA